MRNEIRRFTLDYKGLQYKTVWTEYPDIAATCQSLNIPPTGKWPDGSPMYTLPALVGYISPTRSLVVG